MEKIEYIKNGNKEEIFGEKETIKNTLEAYIRIYQDGKNLELVKKIQEKYDIKYIEDLDEDYNICVTEGTLVMHNVQSRLFVTTTKTDGYTITNKTSEQMHKMRQHLIDCGFEADEDEVLRIKEKYKQFYTYN